MIQTQRGGDYAHLQLLLQQNSRKIHQGMSSLNTGGDPKAPESYEVKDGPL